jgi:zona occludens toxin
VVVFEGKGQRKANIVSVSTKKYDKRIFPLYKSYDGGKGNEATVDGRANLFNNKLFLAVFFGAVAGLLYTGWWFIGYVNDLRKGGKNAAVPAALAKAEAANSSVPVGATSAGSFPPPSPALNSEARLVGIVQQASGETVVVLQLSDGRVVRQRMRSGLVDGWQTIAGYDGQMVGFVFGGKSK